ncbi:Glycosyltransferase [Granulibacter bethesdensis]|uniref:Glycosyltransferase n=2 Tax=Granulibacter bethesdensis TaxID=364410 RepID=A0AAC9K6L6_9PROT|nr:Glycosyltransferase [Granulibacter bethesdensis]APH61274.1 Glycosyltransferase [Granulibacter bethesdensis]
MTDTSSSVAQDTSASVPVSHMPASSTGPAPTEQPAPESKSPYPAVADIPTQEGPRGIRYDFNLGARIALPEYQEKPFIVCLRDIETGNILFLSSGPATFINSAKRFFVRFRIEVWDSPDGGPASGKEPFFVHDYDARDRDILIQFPVGTLGDIMAWFPYAARFAEKHGCKLTCALSELIIPVLEKAYPHITFVTHDEMKEKKLAETFYATYSLGLFFDDVDCAWQPTDFRFVGLHRTAGYILGVDPEEEAPRLALPDESRPIPEPYVCIAVQSSTQSKYWNNPTGWRSVIAELKRAGYRVICIDQKAVHGVGLVWNHIPNGAEDETGNRPLTERARWLRHADFFVGLSSGLSWLAWAAGTPVVMISGFTHPTNEFHTPYRVHNWHTCNSCWNDGSIRFDHHDFMWCPRQKDTPRQFECTRLISADYVIDKIRTIPAFQKQLARMEASAAVKKNETASHPKKLQKV